MKTVIVRVVSETGATLQLRSNSINGPILSEIKIHKSSQWNVTRAQLLKFEPMVQTIFVVLKGSGQAEVDWVSFE